MRLVQFLTNDKRQCVAVVGDHAEKLQVIAGIGSTYDLGNEAIAAASTMEEVINQRGFTETVDYALVVKEGRLLPPLTHPDPLHFFVTGTGLTHLGSADTRDKMHKATQADEKKLNEEKQTDSMKMFAMGLEGGKPNSGQVGVQPEWFYKGDGSSLVAPEAELPLPAFAEDGGEEPEICGLYLIGADRMPYRVGFAIGNEYSDHIMERQNYLWLAPSKVRACSFGPEILLGALPDDIEGTSRILRNGKIFWEKPFSSGEKNMSHTVANLEYHHFKYPIFRQPGTVHCHYFGTATLSFAENIKPQDGDIFEIEAEDFGRPLRNTLRAFANDPFEIKPL